jgi:hypothetical protein
LGWIGVTLIVLLLVHGYRRAVAAFRIDPNSGSLMLAYVLAAAMYSYTEAGFRMLNYAWSFLLLLIIGASYISKVTPANAQVPVSRPPKPVKVERLRPQWQIPLC